MPLPMADKIVMRPVADLIPYARNARTHSDAQVAQIAASIREFGFTNPVLVDGENGIVAGHGRVLAARKLSMVQVPRPSTRFRNRVICGSSAATGCCVATALWPPTSSGPFVEKQRCA
jgi:hypothetical protein